MEHTEKVATFVAETRYETIPSKAIEVAKEALLDCLGVALAGSRESSSRICALLAHEEKAEGRATLWGHGLKSSPLNAAFTNGVSAHALDYDHSFHLMGQPTAGLAGRNGVLAAQLAKKGFTANSHILEGALGLFAVYSRGLHYDPAPLNNLGISWELVERGIKVKAYPCGGLSHSAIDAVLEMRRQHSIRPDSVDWVNAEVTQRTFDRIIYRIPESGLQGKFSMPYILARALIDGKIAPDAFTDEAVRDPSVLRLAGRIYMEPNRELKENAAGSRPCRVAIRLKDGRTFSHRVDYPKGSSQVPVSPEELRAKFVACAEGVLKKNSVEQVLGYLDRLESVENVRSLCEQLRGEGEPLM